METGVGGGWRGGGEGGVGEDDLVGDPYCFESDPVALKNNTDYQALLRCICLLETQRATALSHLDLLHNAHQQVLADPIVFVDRLQRTGNLGIQLPGRQKIAELPAIDWKKYTDSVDFRSFGTHRQSARLKHHGNETTEADQVQQLKQSLEGGEGAEGSVSEGFVRGRFKDESKSATFNKLWTPEEQRRLDELLIKYPPEEVEARRWRKIAAAFGDRTPQQIASRVQKYFQKLERNKLPVPGRVPNRAAPRLKKASHRHHGYSWPQRDSTFLQSYLPPVMMREEGEEVDSHHAPSLPSAPPGLTPTLTPTTTIPTATQREGEEEGGRVSGVQDQSDEEGVPEEVQQTAEYRELKHLKRLRHEALRHLDPSTPLHNGFKCDDCGCDPIVGVRWHCVDCPSSTSLDFCDTCVHSVGSFETACHNSSHRLRPVKRTWVKVTHDQDYMNFGNNQAATNYNYLDPNYMPAV